MTIGICTDSHAQLPPELVHRFGVAVVPITVRVGECEYLEGVDLALDDFYAWLREEQPPEVTTACPSPGQFSLAYDELAERGCTQILSIHASADAAGTLNAARLAAHASPVPVRLVDSGTRSFGVSCAVWAAADAIAAGASLEEASHAAESLAPHIGNVFVVGALGLLGLPSRAGGGRLVAPGAGAELLSYRDGRVDVLGEVETAPEAIDAMCRHAASWGEDLRVAVGTADCAAAPLSDALASALAASGSVREVVSYRVGPSVGAHTGPGTVTCCMFPASSRA